MNSLHWYVTVGPRTVEQWSVHFTDSVRGFSAFTCLSQLLPQLQPITLRGLSARISQKPHARTSYQIFVHVVMARSFSGGVLICLCTSGFADGVMFSHSDPTARECDMHNSRDSNQSLPDLQLFIVGCMPERSLLATIALQVGPHCLHTVPRYGLLHYILTTYSGLSGLQLRDRRDRHELN